MPIFYSTETHVKLLPFIPKYFIQILSFLINADAHWQNIDGSVFFGLPTFSEKLISSYSYEHVVTNIWPKYKKILNLSINLNPS